MNDRSWCLTISPIAFEAVRKMDAIFRPLSDCFADRMLTARSTLTLCLKKAHWYCRAICLLCFRAFLAGVGVQPSHPGVACV